MEKNKNQIKKEDYVQTKHDQAQPVSAQPEMRSAGSGSGLISISQLFKKTWELFKAGFWKLLAIYGIGMGINFGLVLLLALIVLISVLLGIIQIDTAGLQEKLSPPGGLAPALLQSSGLAVWSAAKFLSDFALPLVLGLSIFLGIAISGYWISASSFVLISGILRNIGIKESLKQAWKKLGSFVWVNLLEGLAVCLGFLLLIVPGIIFMTWFMFAPYIFICDGIKGKAALSRSKELVKGHFWPVFSRILIMTLIMMSVPLLNYLLPVIGFLVGIAFSFFSLVYYYVLYRDLQRVKQEQVN